MTRAAGFMTSLAVGALALACQSPAASGPVGQTPGQVATASPAASASPAVSAPASVVPTAGAAPEPADDSARLPPFTCNAQSAAGGEAGMVAVRAGAHPDFDRFVIQFDKAVPAYEARPQPTASFMLDPSGQSVTLQGRAGVSIKLRGTSGQGTFNGPSDLRPAFVELREARLLGDFERVVTWGLGLTRPACLRTFSLDAPPRLVVDVRAV